ncbi:hypothetical protein LJC45_03795 [Alistipes sp. OttesenSCG-928-B03]|nr:hypothetical protein [Alistipes sp. OttesenSCG-928-B03]
MKAKFLFALPLLFGAIATGCDNAPETANNGGEKDVLVVKLPGADKTRAVETPQNTGDATETLNDVTVYLIEGNLVTRTEVFSSNERDLKKKRIEQVSRKVDKVIVVANTNGFDLSTIVNNTSTANDVRKLAFDVASQHHATNSHELEGRTLVGEATPTNATDPDPHGHNYKEAVVSLDAITSRIEVGTVKAGTGIKNIELLAVYINSYYTTNLKDVTSFKGELWDQWPATPATPAKNNTLHAAFDPATDVAPDKYTSVHYVDRANSEVKLADNTKAYSYHVFSGNVPHLILLVRGEYQNEGDTQYIPLDDNDEEMPYFLGWVTYTKYKESEGGYVAKMLPNNIYKMGVGTNGIVINAKDIEKRPEPEDYDLGLEVVIKTWTANVVTPEV